MNDQLKRTVGPLSDEEIVDLYWQRDENAIEETDVKYKKYLLSVACHFVSDRSDLEECLSDTYVGAWNAIPPARPKALQAFLTIIMRRTAINCYKINRRKKRIPAELTDVYEDFADFIAAEQDVSADVESRELEAVINTYVRTLSDRQMYIFMSRYYFARSIHEIGKALGCSTSTINKEIAKIKNGLKNSLMNEGYIL